MGKKAFEAIDISTSMVACRIVSAIKHNGSIKTVKKDLQEFVLTDVGAPQFIKDMARGEDLSFVACFIPGLAEEKEFTLSWLKEAIKRDPENIEVFERMMNETGVPEHQRDSKREEMCTVVANKAFELLLWEAASPQWHDVMERSPGQYGMLLLGSKDDVPA